MNDNEFYSSKHFLIVLSAYHQRHLDTKLKKRWPSVVCHWRLVNSSWSMSRTARSWLSLYFWRRLLQLYTREIIRLPMDDRFWAHYLRQTTCFAHRPHWFRNAGILCIRWSHFVESDWGGCRAKYSFVIEEWNSDYWRVLLAAMVLHRSIFREDPSSAEQRILEQAWDHPGMESMNKISNNQFCTTKYSFCFRKSSLVAQNQISLTPYTAMHL